MAEFSNTQKIPLVAVVGPTASGKTELAISIAKKYNGEIISMDSMQIYKLMNIGTAKPTEDETEGIPHHMLDCVMPGKAFSANDYVEMAKPIISDIFNRGKLPVLCGGTGLYLNSLLYSYNMSEATYNYQIRDALYRDVEENGIEYLWEKLRSIDPKSAEEIHPNNVKRVVRAIEIFVLTGKPRSEQLTSAPESNYDYVVIGIDRNRDELYHRINRRVDIMIEKGLENEVRELLEKGHLKNGRELTQAGQAIGYKEMLSYIDGEKTLDEATEQIKMNSRRYAKRQMTWFKRIENIMWLDLKNENSISEARKNIENLIERTFKNEN